MVHVRFKTKLMTLIIYIDMRMIYCPLMLLFIVVFMEKLASIIDMNLSLTHAGLLV